MNYFEFFSIIIIFIITSSVIFLCDKLLERLIIKDELDCCSIDTETVIQRDNVIQPKITTETVIQPKITTETVDITTETVDINSEYIIVLSRDKCPFCIKLIEEYSSKTPKKHAIINLKNDLSFSFDNNFLNIEPLERENIIKGLQNVLIRRPILFPTIIYNKNITRGLKRKELDNIFFDLE